LKALAVAIQGLDADAPRAVHFLVEAGHRQAAFVVAAELSSRTVTSGLITGARLVAILGHIHHQHRAGAR
jgi:hypothetical protein